MEINKDVLNIGSVVVPSYEKYLEAKSIIAAYENELKRLHNIKVEAFKKDLDQYFAENLLDGFYKIEEYTLSDNNIIPLNPALEEGLMEGLRLIKLGKAKKK